RQPARGAVPGLLRAAAPRGIAGHAPRDRADRRPAADGGGPPGRLPGSGAAARHRELPRRRRPSGRGGEDLVLVRPSWFPPATASARSVLAALGPAHAGAVAGTAAAVAAGVTWIAVPTHPGVPPAGAATPGVTGRADPAPGHDGQPGTPGASATARPGALPAAIASSGAGSPDAGVMAVSPSAGASGAGVGVSPSPSPSVSASASIS